MAELNADPAARQRLNLVLCTVFIKTVNMSKSNLNFLAIASRLSNGSAIKSACIEKEYKSNHQQCQLQQSSRLSSGEVRKVKSGKLKKIILVFFYFFVLVTRMSGHRSEEMKTRAIARR